MPPIEFRYKMKQYIFVASFEHQKTSSHSGRDAPTIQMSLISFDLGSRLARRQLHVPVDSRSIDGPRDSMGLPRMSPALDDFRLPYRGRYAIARFSRGLEWEEEICIHSHGTGLAGGYLVSLRKGVDTGIGVE